MIDSRDTDWIDVCDATPLILALNASLGVRLPPETVEAIRKLEAGESA